MGGAMAGSAICSARDSSDVLDLVTVTINNVCNLSCPHCYLQYAGVSSLIEESSLAQVTSSSFRHLCIVGMEPLANRASTDLVERMVRTVVASGKSISLITNGLNLQLLSADVLKKLSWVDVSVDGTSRSYKELRGGSYDKLRRGIGYALECGLRELRILHTISSANVGELRDMLSEAFLLGSSLVVISPFQRTHAARAQSVEMVEPQQLLKALMDTGLADDPRLRLIFDIGYLRHFQGSEVVEVARGAFKERFVYIASDPIDRGLIRVTYDGLVLTPFESIHTSDYPSVGRPLEKHGLDQWFEIIRGGVQHSFVQCY